MIKYIQDICQYGRLFNLDTLRFVSHIEINILKLLIITLNKVVYLIEHIDEVGLLILTYFLKVSIIYELLSIIY